MADILKSGLGALAHHPEVGLAGVFGETSEGRTFVEGMVGVASGRARTRLNRKAFQVGQRVFGAEMFCLSRAVDYVQTLPDVQAMVGVAPPVARVGMDFLADCGKPCLLISNGP